MIFLLGMNHIDEILTLQRECLINRDLFLPTSREGYLRAFQFDNFCYGYREREDTELLAFLNCSMPTARAKINLGQGRVPEEELDRVGHMNTLLVHRSIRKTGVGTALVNRSLIEFARHQCRHIYVTIAPENQGSAHLLKALEFHPVDQIQLKGEKRILLYRALW